MFKNRLHVLTAVCLVAGCSTVTIQPTPIAKLTTSPSYQETKHFYLWGLVGEEHIDVKEVCGSKAVKQMQSQQTFINGLVGGLTLGIYSPHSVKVWCD